MAPKPGDLLSVTGDGTVLAQLGRRLRARRQELGLTQGSVAGLADVSVSYLSELEAGNNTPSLPLLARLAHSLDLSVNELLRDTSSGPIATGTLDDQRPGFETVAAAELRLHVVRQVAAGVERGEPPVAHAAGDLFVHVRRGSIAITIGDERHELGEGDSLQATHPRVVTWETEEPALVLWVTARPEPGDD